MELTDAGRALLPDARRLLKDADQATLNVGAAASGMRGQVRLGFVGSSVFWSLPRIVRTVNHEFPEVALTLLELTSEQQRDALRDRRIDLGLVRYSIDDADVTSDLFEREPFRVALPATSRLAGSNAAVSQRDLEGTPLVMFPRHLGPANYDKIMSMFSRDEVSPMIGQEAVQLITIAALVSAGVGAAIVPASLENAGLPGVVYREFVTTSGDTPESHLFLIRRANDQSQAAIRVVELMLASRPELSRSI